MTMRWRHERAIEEGSAIVEFCYLAILLMVPLAYLVLVVFRVQAASYGVAAASRDAGRAFVTADSGREATDRAHIAAAIALRDQGLALDPDRLSLRCSARPCLTPGSTVAVTVSATVDLPLLPAVFADAVNASVTVEGSHLEVVDPYAPARP
jgi:Tfp pilus assembly protein PilX